MCGRLCVFCERCVCVLVQNTISVLWLCGGSCVRCVVGAWGVVCLVEVCRFMLLIGVCVVCLL